MVGDETDDVATVDGVLNTWRQANVPFAIAGDTPSLRMRRSQWLLGFMAAAEVPAHVFVTWEEAARSNMADDEQKSAYQRYLLDTNGFRPVSTPVKAARA